LPQLFLRKGLDDPFWGARHLESAGNVGLEIALLLSESEEGLQSTGLTLDRAWGESPLLTMVEPRSEVGDTQLRDHGGMLMVPKEESEVAEESVVPRDRFGAQTLAGVVESETFNQCLNLHEKASS